MIHFDVARGSSFSLLPAVCFFLDGFSDKRNKRNSWEMETFHSVLGVQQGLIITDSESFHAPYASRCGLAAIGLSACVLFRQTCCLRGIFI